MQHTVTKILTKIGVIPVGRINDDVFYYSRQWPKHPLM